MIYVGAFVAIALIGVGFGVAIGSRGGDSSQSGDQAAQDSGDSVGAVEDGRAGSAGLGEVTVTSGPAQGTAPSPSEQARVAAGGFVDDDHLVELVILPEFEMVKTFDGASARWSSGAVVMSYEVVPLQSVEDAFDRRRSLRNELARVTYDPDGAGAPQDGRYVVTGWYPDGSFVYERGRIRCGDLVRYRFEWDTEMSDPLVDEATSALVSADPAQDSMGGVHPVC